jgi:ATP-dependent DNA ligase
MLLKPAAMLPSGPAWRYELKLDGYRWRFSTPATAALA